MSRLDGGSHGQQEVSNMWLNIIGSSIALVGTCVALDARRLVKKYFNFGEENNAVLGLKIMGIIIIFIGGIILLAAN